MLADILGKNRLCRLGFYIPVGCITARQAVMLNKALEELPFEFDKAGADDIELQEIAEKATKSMEDLISHLNDQQSQTDDLLEYGPTGPGVAVRPLPLREPLGLDKQLRSIRGSLKVEVAKKLELEEHIAKEHRKLEEF